MRYTWSDYKIAGPKGKIVAFIDPITVQIKCSGSRTIFFRLAGLALPSDENEGNNFKLRLSEMLTGMTADTFIYHWNTLDGEELSWNFEKWPEKAKVSGTIFDHKHRDIALNMILEGRARFQWSEFTSPSDHCLYEKAELAARAAHLGIWNTSNDK